MDYRFEFCIVEQETRRELEVLFSQLSREHGELQRNYQLLHEKLRQLTSFSETDYAANSLNYAALQADYTAARARIRDLEEILQLKKNQQEPKEQAKTAAVPSLLEIQAKFVREKHAMQTQLALLNHRLVEAKERHQAVMAELNEARDQNELLEFRILELEEAQEKVQFHFLSINLVGRNGESKWEGGLGMNQSSLRWNPGRNFADVSKRVVKQTAKDFFFP